MSLNKRVFQTLLLSLALLSAGLVDVKNVQAGAWDNIRSWTPEEEILYSQWVSQNWGIHYFNQPGTPYTGMLLDCADFVYAMRIIYAAERGLPFVMKDPSGGKNPISNSMTRFDKVADPGKRKRAFLNYVYQVASTSSIPNDTVPVAITREKVRSGVIILTDKKAHHSWTIRNLSIHAIPHLVFASRPARTKGYERYDFPSNGFTFPNGVSLATRAGIRAFRQPVDIGKSEWQVSGYSEEQYAVSKNRWRENLTAKLALSEEPADLKLGRLLSEACNAAGERVEAVNEGLAALRKLKADQCFAAGPYDDFSTPSRDLRLKDTILELEKGISDERAAQTADPSRMKLPPELEARLNAYLASDVAVCPVKASPTIILSLKETLRRLNAGVISNNPHDPVEYRWGLKAGHSDRANRCPSY